LRLTILLRLDDEAEKHRRILRQRENKTMSVYAISMGWAIPYFI
jgi:hypothetical protein